MASRSGDFTFWCANCKETNRYGRFTIGDSRKWVHTFNFGESPPEMTTVLLSSEKRLIHKVSELSSRDWGIIASLRPGGNSNIHKPIRCPKWRCTLPERTSQSGPTNELALYMMSGKFLT